MKPVYIFQTIFFLFLFIALISLPVNGQSQAQQSPGLSTTGQDVDRNFIILITIDALRADKMGFNGNWRDPTPHLDYLAKQSVTFQNVQATSPHTYPSIGSILTGLFPLRHGSVYNSSALDRQNRTLPEILKRNGFQTAAFVCNAWLTPQLGFNQGFDEFQSFSDELTSPRIHQKILTWMDAFLGFNKVFLWLHYLDPHAKYTSYLPFVRRFEQNYSGTFTTFTNSDANSYKDRSRLLDPADLEHVKLLYESEVSFCDRHIGAIIAKITRTSNNIHLIVTSDHGEELQEHGGSGHDHSVYEELLAVPLLWYAPSTLPRGKIVPAQVQISDIAPSLLEILGIDGSPYDFDGRSVIPFIFEQSTEREVKTFSMRYFINPDHHVFTVRKNNWKLQAFCVHSKNKTTPLTPSSLTLQTTIEQVNTIETLVDYEQYNISYRDGFKLLGSQIKCGAKHVHIDLLWQQLNQKSSSEHFCFELTTRDQVFVLPGEYQSKDKMLADYVLSRHIIKSEHGLLGMKYIYFYFGQVEKPLSFMQDGRQRDKILLLNNSLIAQDQIRNWEIYHNDSTFKLFNLDDDPRELHDVSAEFPEIVGELKKELSEFVISKQERFFDLTEIKIDVFHS